MIGSRTGCAELIEVGDPRWGRALDGVLHDYFHLPGYLKASARHQGGEPLAFFLEAGNHGMLLPLVKRALLDFEGSLAGFFDVTSPYGYPSPLYWGPDWQERLPEMHEAMEACLRRERVVALFVRLNPFVGPPDALLAPLGTVKQHGPTVFIDLRDADASWNGINAGNRRFISRMLSRGFTVRIDHWDTLDTVIEAYYETMRRLWASPFYFFPRDYFQALVDGTAPHLHLATSYTPGGQITGGVLFTESGGLVQYYLTGTFEDYMDVSPGKLLINGLRLWGLEHGHHTLHLGGGLGARRDGLFEFKARLSKCTATFSTFQKVILPDVYEDLARAHGIAKCDDAYFPIYRKSE